MKSNRTETNNGTRHHFPKICILAALIFCIYGTAVPFQAASDSSQKEAAPITLMIYMCGSDLEEQNGSATQDIMEMLGSGFDWNAVQVLLMTGGSKSWTGGYSAGETSIYRIARGNTIRVLQEECRNMGDPETLLELLNFGYETCPAQKYALIFWDHGGGPMNGICWDTLAEGDHLTMKELDSALAQSPFAVEPLEWAGFDACLMSSIETAHVMAPYARYMIASQELEPSHGWNYAFLNGLEKDMAGSDTGKRIIDFYMQDADAKEGLTLSCCNLSAIGDVEEGISAFFSDLSGIVSEETFSRLSNERQSAREFGKGPQEEENYDLVDLAGLIRAYSPEKPEGARALTEALDKMVLYNGSTLEDSCGLSIYHPYGNKSLFQKEWKDGSAAFAMTEAYVSYLRRYARIWLGKQLADWSGLTGTRDRDGEGGHTFSFQLTDEQAAAYASSQLLILKQEELNSGDMVYESMYLDDSTQLSDDNVLTCSYSGRMLYVVDENNEPLTIPVGYRIEDGQYVIQATYMNMAEERVARTLLYCEPDGDGEDLKIVKTLTRDAASGLYTRRLDIVPELYSQIFFRHDVKMETRDEGGNLKAFRDWDDSEALIFYEHDMDKVDPLADWHFRFLDTQRYDEKLYASFQILDTQGNAHSSGLTQVRTEGALIFPTEQILEDEDCAVSLETVLYDREGVKGLELTFTVENRSGIETVFWIDTGSILINGSRKTYSQHWDKIRSISAGPGQERVLRFFFDAEELAGLDQIRTMEFSLNLNREETLVWAETVPEITKALNISYMDLDVSGILRSDTDEVLAETQENGMIYQLRSLKQEEDGSISGVLYCENTSEQTQSRAFQLPALNDIMVRREEWLTGGSESSRLEFTAEPGDQFYLPFRLPNERGLSIDASFFEPYIRTPDPIGSMGQTQIESLLFYEPKDVLEPEKSRSMIRLELKKAFPINENKDARKEPAQSPVLLLQEERFSVSCTRITRVDDCIVLTAEIANLIDEEQEFVFTGARLGGGDAYVGDQKFLAGSDHTVTVPAGVRYETYLFFRSKEDLAAGEDPAAEEGDTAAEEGDLAAEEDPAAGEDPTAEENPAAPDLDFRILNSHRDKQCLYYCELNLARVLQREDLSKPEGIYPDIEVCAGCGYASDACNDSVISPQLKLPEGHTGCGKELQFAAPGGEDRKISNVFAWIAVRKDAIPLPQMGNKILPGDCLMPVSYVQMQKGDGIGIWNGRYSGMVLTVADSECEMADGHILEQCIPVLEDGVMNGPAGIQPMPSEYDPLALYADQSSLYGTILPEIRIRFDPDTGLADRFFCRVLNRSYTGEQWELEDWPASCAGSLSCAMRCTLIEEQNDGTFRIAPVGAMVTFCPGEDIPIANRPLTLSLVPVEEYDPSIWVVYEVNYSDGSQVLFGPEAY